MYFPVIHPILSVHSFFPSKTALRVEMARLAVEGIDEISVGKWESMGQDERWPDYPEVLLLTIFSTSIYLFFGE